jgi:hypothetical protein
LDGNIKGEGAVGLIPKGENPKVLRPAAAGDHAEGSVGFMPKIGGVGS